MQDLSIILYGMAFGFVVSGLLSSGYQVLTGRPLRFAFRGNETPMMALLGMALRVLAGPVILARHALRRLDGPDADPLLVSAMLALACVWSFLFGLIVLDSFGGLAPMVTGAL